MFVSYVQLGRALRSITNVHPFFGIAFLGIKQHTIPVASTREFIISRTLETILEQYYRPTESFDGFYQPFRSSRPTDRWVSKRYGSTGLQRIIVDTFGVAFIHPRGTSQWGWRSDYVDQLAQLQKQTGTTPIPIYALASWLFRNRDFASSTSPAALRDQFVHEFKITRPEFQSLFIDDYDTVPDGWLSETPVQGDELLSLTGYPPGDEEVNNRLTRISLSYVGPSKLLQLHPGRRLNLITGDNSLGKSFILQCIWWAMTGRWIDGQAVPHQDSERLSPQIEFDFETSQGRQLLVAAQYDWSQSIWRIADSAHWSPSNIVGVYAHYDGSYAIWDPTTSGDRPGHRDDTYLTLSRDEVWNSKRRSDQITTHVICNGLIGDWIDWQQRGNGEFAALQRAITSLSPSHWEKLTPGTPTKLPGDERWLPTLRMPYGEIPVIHASAGVRRALALAYVILWTWNRHQHAAKLHKGGKAPDIVILIDEVEAHLHPRWQRLVVPALTAMIREIAAKRNVQLYIATHSPLVLASAEPTFDSATDRLHHLQLVDKEVTLQDVPFVRHGSADSWLTSDIFGMAQPRSIDAERAITNAVALQLAKNPTEVQVRQVHRSLQRVLAESDAFWPRWLFFAEKHGVIE